MKINERDLYYLMKCVELSRRSNDIAILKGVIEDLVEYLIIALDKCNIKIPQEEPPEE